jgi:capsular polysaccharide biosynthesis protein
MELRQYGEIVRRRWWLPAALVALVLLASLLFRPARAPQYQVSMRFSMGIAPEPQRPNTYNYDRYYTYLTSEYLVDDFSEVVKSAAFAQAVSERLAQGAHPIQVPVGAIQGSTRTGKLHRILWVSITWGDPEQLRAIAEAVVQTLQQDNARFFAQLGAEGAQVFLLDPPSVGVVGAGLREKLDLPLRLALALAAGLALAFLGEYLDTSVRDRAEVEAMGIRVLGELPRPRGRRLWGR